MIWADSKVREGVIREMRSQLYEKGSAIGSPIEAVSSMEPPNVVSARYKEIYGYGTAFSVIVAIGASLLALLTLTPLNSGVENILAVVFYPLLLVVVAYVAFAGGRNAGLIVSAGPIVVRLLMLVILTMLNDFEPAGIVMFLIATAIIPIAAYVGGEARKKWSEGMDV